MIFTALALALQVAASPPVRAYPDSAGAATAALTVRVRSRAIVLSVTSVGGIAYVSAEKLAAALGGTFGETSPTHYALTVGDSHISFTDGVPFAANDSDIVPIPAPPRVIGNAVYLPLFVVSDLVPRFFTGFNYDPDTREVRSFNQQAHQVARTDDPASRAESGASHAPDRTDVASGSEGIIAVAKSVSDPGFHKRAGHRLIVVDAGHGGPDNGMTGPLGGGGPHVVEKNITLQVSKFLAQVLRDQGADVLLTRTTDTLIGLYDRGPIANRSHADVFVSIHVNATGQRGIEGVRDRGYETYFLSEAKTEDAKRVERMENDAVKFETGVSADKGDPLSFILNDMAQNEHLRESADLATMIQTGFRSFHPGPDRGVQQANFAVLRGSFMPAVLVEIGFGTNPSEAAFITDADNQREIARSIAKSVMAYLNRYDARVAAGAGK